MCPKVFFSDRCGLWTKGSPSFSVFFLWDLQDLKLPFQAELQ